MLLKLMPSIPLFTNSSVKKLWISLQFTSLIITVTVRNIDIDDFIKSPPSCDCASSPFRSVRHGHVFTGDFGIIQNKELKRLLLKGPTYREQTSINWGYNHWGCLLPLRTV